MINTRQLDSFRTRQYFITFMLEIVTGLVRVGVVFIASSLLFSAIAMGIYFSQLSDSTLFYKPRLDLGVPVFIAFFVSTGFGYRNVFRSWLSYTSDSGGDGLTRFVLGAREPSQREHEKLNQAFKQMVQRAEQPIKSFSYLFVIDSPAETAYVIGTTLYISSGALRGRHFEALLAHEIGHLHYGHGKTILALRRFIFPLYQYILGGIRDFSTARPAPRPQVTELDAVQLHYQMVNRKLFFRLALWGGGLGVSMRSATWAAYFRECDYVADAFAIQLGFKEELLNYLEESKFYDTSVPFMLSWYPANEQRIDRILNPTRRQQARSKDKVTIRPFIEENEADYRITVSLQEAFLGTQTAIQTKTGQTVTLTIPRGVATNNAIIRDDLGKVFIRVLDDPNFERRGNDLYATLIVARTLLEEGGEVQVDTLEGTESLQVPTNTPNEATFTLQGRGMPVLGQSKQPGDLFVTISYPLQPEVEEETSPELDPTLDEAAAPETESVLPPPKINKSQAQFTEFVAEHTVETGDDLYVISEKYYGTQGNWQVIYEINKETIGDSPEMIYIGQILKIPKL